MVRDWRYRGDLKHDVHDEVYGEVYDEVYHKSSEVSIGCQHFVVLESVSIALQQYKLGVLC